MFRKFVRCLTWFAKLHVRVVVPRQSLDIYMIDTKDQNQKRKDVPGKLPETQP